MIQVQVEVESGAGRFLVSARAASIGRALSLVSAGNPGSKARIISPREPEPPPAGEASDREDAVVLDPVGSAA